MAVDEQTVFIVDDDPAVRDSIKELVESIALRAEVFDTGQAFVDAVESSRTGCLILDVRLPVMSGLIVQEKLNELGFSLPVIILTGHADVPMAVRALKAGAIDFVQKPYRDQLLLDSINEALAADAAARRSRGGSDRFHQQLGDLTKREREVLDKLLEGETSKHIARELSISPRTVEAHRYNLLHKLGVPSVKELILRSAVRGEDE